MTKDKEYRFTFKKMMIHLRTILKHRHYVFIYCCKCGIFWQGLVHDLSKFSPVEFFINVKYTEPGKSPVTIQLEKIGYSFSWLHHKGHNPHHYVFWMDKFDDGCYVHRMPFKYTVEMFCDYLGASKAYDKATSYDAELKWWSKKREEQNMHPDNRTFLDILIGMLAIMENGKEGYDNIPERVNIGIFLDYLDRNKISIFDKKFLEDLYQDIVENSEYESCCKIRQPKSSIIELQEYDEMDTQDIALSNAKLIMRSYIDSGLNGAECVELFESENGYLKETLEKYNIYLSTVYDLAKSEK